MPGPLRRSGLRRAMSPSDTTMPVWDRRTLLELSQSPLVSPPSNMKPLDEWYGYVCALMQALAVLHTPSVFESRPPP